MNTRARRWWFSALLLAAALAFTAVAGARLSAAATQLEALRKREAAAAQRLEAARGERERLQAEIRRLQTAEYVETVARQQLGYIRPGEIPYMAVPPGRQPPGEPGSPGSPLRVAPEEYRVTDASEAPDTPSPAP